MTIKLKRTAAYHTWVYKCIWGSTAIHVKVPGKNYADACKRVDSMVKRMEGGSCVVEIKFVKQIN